ncbi:hypothetical protein ACJJTC_000994 [Scirpophaga incertulas]
MSYRCNISLKFLVTLGLCFYNMLNNAYGQQNENTTSTVYMGKHAQVLQEETNLAPTQEPTDEGPVIKRSSLHHHETNPTFHGFWKKKMTWRPRWVKTWQAKKVYVAVWKKMWGPAMLTEWVPIPKPPPGWLKQKAYGHATVYAHSHPYL